MRRITLSLLATLVALPLACAGRQTGATAPGPGDERARNAALAVLVVDNRTPHRLSVGYTHAGGPDGLVLVGTVAPNDTARMAPVPAAEPLNLLARREDGATLRLPPRSIPVDSTWRWVIPADASFAFEPERRR